MSAATSVGDTRTKIRGLDPPVALRRSAGNWSAETAPDTGKRTSKRRFAHLCKTPFLSCPLPGRGEGLGAGKGQVAHVFKVTYHPSPFLILAEGKPHDHVLDPVLAPISQK